MAKIVKFVYVTIIFLYMFHISTNIEAGNYKCQTNYDCLRMWCPIGISPRCIKRRCKCIETLVQ
ncbi:putative Late nodulin [Medicago truncatula]|uniref:Putative Late nodulin n=1 Tax=Medicago truncatula TaxID=3880 RepID=A0A396IXZ0_MEDTR|nr:putative Late nodulin [Medicago truncatula]